MHHAHFVICKEITSVEIIYVTVFNAVVQGITWSNIWFTESACTAAGLKSVPFSKSVNNDNAGCTRTCATR